MDCNALRPAGDEQYLSDEKIVWKLSWGGRITAEEGFIQIIPEMFQTTQPGFWITTFAEDSTLF